MLLGVGWPRSALGVCAVLVSVSHHLVVTVAHRALLLTPDEVANVSIPKTAKMTRPRSRTATPLAGSGRGSTP